MGDGYSSDEDLPENWQLYSKRPEWQDVTPLPQDDGENPVVVISYSEKFTDVYNYFRAIVSKSEKSERALELTRDALRLNAANYTVWQYRRDILKALNYDLNEELAFVEDVIDDNPKNYQVWHHRRVIVEWLNDPSHELELTENILSRDAKNYHAWQHRQWAIKTYNLFDDEFNYVDRLLGEDLRNNSAWNQRFFILKYTGFSTEVLQREINYVMNRIRVIKNNESSWNFLRGILQQGDGTLSQFPEVIDFCEDLYNNGIRSPYLLAFLIDLYEEQCLKQNTNVDDDEEEIDRNDLKIKILKLCECMANNYDTIRKKYWEYVAEHFMKKFNKLKSINTNNDYTTTTSASDDLSSKS